MAVASATAATYTAGNGYTFSVLGNQVSFVVGANGYLILSKVYQRKIWSML